MVITYNGLQFFKLQYGETVVAFDPPSADSKYKSARFGADIVMSSIRHEDMSGGDLLSGGSKNPIVITGPGEYEVQDIFIRAFSSESMYGVPASGGRSVINTMYYLKMEDMDILFLGALGNPEISPSAAEAIDNVDILFLPIGGGGVLTSSEAHKLSVKFEASIVIPMNYDKEALSAFLKEGGVDVKPVDKLTVKQKDISKEGSTIVVLENTAK